MFGYRLGKGGTSLVLALVTFTVPSLVPTARSLSYMATAAAAMWCWTLVRLRRLTREPPYVRGAPSRDAPAANRNAERGWPGQQQEPGASSRDVNVEC